MIGVGGRAYIVTVVRPPMTTATFLSSCKSYRNVLNDYKSLPTGGLETAHGAKLRGTTLHLFVPYSTGRAWVIGGSAIELDTFTPSFYP